MSAFGLGCCDRCHRLLFEYPIIFWTADLRVTVSTRIVGHDAPFAPVRYDKSPARLAPHNRAGRGAYATHALPDLCLGIVSGRLEPHQVSLGFSGCYALEAPARPGLSFSPGHRNPQAAPVPN
jgi:hypothetical protein